MISRLIYPIFRIFARHRVEEMVGIENIPKKGPVVLAVNHIDYLDGWLLVLLLIPRIKRNIYFISQSKNYFWTNGVTIPLEKYGKEEALTNALGYLKNGKIIAMFPEGSRNSQKELLKGKTGAARLALWAKCPVVPIGITGPSAVNFMSSLIKLFFRPKQVTIKVGSSLNLKEYYGKAIGHDLLTECTAKIMKAIGALADKNYLY